MTRDAQEECQPTRRPSRLPRVAAPLAVPRSARRRRTLREQLARAAMVQRSMFPDISLPVGEFRLSSLYWPCDTLGGDFYDLARRPDCGVLLVADVMGHGVEAALITMLVKAAFQETADRASDPGELLAAMRYRLRRTVPPGHTFVATMIVRLDLTGSGVQVANAGLPHPFVLRGAERQLDEVSLDGVPLCLADDLGHDACHTRGLTLEPGDVLLIASDGIGSVEDGCGDYFDDRRLRQALANMIGRGGNDVIDQLAAEAVVFGHGRRFPDDVNLMAIWRPDPEPVTAGPLAAGDLVPCVN